MNKIWFSKIRERKIIKVLSKIGTYTKTDKRGGLGKQKNQSDRSRTDSLREVSLGQTQIEKGDHAEEE